MVPSVEGRKYFGMSKFSVGSEDLTGVEVVAEPAASIRGRIVTDDGSELDLKGVEIVIRPWQTEPRIQKQPDGGFSIDDVFSGEYRLVLGGLPPGAYMKSLRFGGREILDAGFTTRGGELIDDVI